MFNKKLFYILLFLLPINLGIHFENKASYVEGILVDYLVPTLYVQDILIVFLVLIWGYKFFKNKTTFTENTWHFRILLLYVVSVLLSVVVSINLGNSLFVFTRLVFYILFAFFVGININVQQEFKKIVFILSVSVFLVSLLGLAQWFTKGSVFDNYLFFGEQPYNYSTFGIHKENLFGNAVIPPYGLFRHPNVFGGFLSILLVWFYSVKKGKNTGSSVKKYYAGVFALGSIVLFLTQSYVAIVTFLIGVLFTHHTKLRKLGERKLFFLILFGFILVAAFLPFFSRVTDSNSISRRVELNAIASDAIKENLLFGVGYGSGTEVIGVFSRYYGGMNIPQPPHNIFVLLFFESGVFSLLFFVLFLFLILRGWLNWISISIYQMVILGLFDHYLFTQHQTQLLMWLTVGFYFSYNLNTYYDK